MTYREFLIDKGVSRSELEQVTDPSHQLDTPCRRSSGSEALQECFTWRDSKQGQKFWSVIDDQLIDYGMTSLKAKMILSHLERHEYKFLEQMNISVYGNKGRMWSNEACITDLDHLKGECNPRLASNYCTVANIGCPKCLETLTKIAEGEMIHEKPQS